MNRTTEAPALLNAGEPPSARKVAVIVCHGMGQQVPFETLGVFIDALKNAAGHKDLPESLQGTRVNHRAVRILPDDDRLLPLARVEVEPSELPPRTLDFYEAYWAPVTAGRVRLVDSILFYFNAGWLGMQFGLGGGFDRWLGDELPPKDKRDGVPGQAGVWRFPLKWTLQIKLAVALIVLAFLVLAIVAVELLALLVAAHYARIPGLQDIPAPFLIVHGVLWAGVAIVLLLLPISASLLGRASIHAPERPTPIRKEDVPPSRGLGFKITGLLVFLALVAAPVALGLLATSWGWHRLEWRVTPFLSGRLVFLLVALLLLWVVLWLRRFLIEYTGDVAAYMSAHRVSRFAEIRNEIQARCCRVMNFVYGLMRTDGQPEYDEVIVVGHSLGSVVAYDTLNEVIARDRAEPTVNAANRTSLLLTLGSPLDKIAFIFRSQKPSDTIDIREELAAERQPMLLSPNLRPLRWVNIYHPLDWIASALDYFNLQTFRDDPRRVVDNVLDDGGSFASAHSNYWRRPNVGRVMLWAAAGFLGPRPLAKRERQRLKKEG